MCSVFATLTPRSAVLGHRVMACSRHAAGLAGRFDGVMLSSSYFGTGWSPPQRPALPADDANQMQPDVALSWSRPYATGTQATTMRREMARMLKRRSHGDPPPSPLIPAV